METFRGRKGLNLFALFLARKSPRWAIDGMRRRTMGRLGAEIMFRHWRGMPMTPAFNKLADVLDTHPHPETPETKGWKARIHKILSSVTYVAPTLVAGLCATFVSLFGGLAIQVADSIALDSGESFLGALQDHGINLSDPEMMARAMKEPLILEDVFRQAAISGSVEMAIGVACVGVGHIILNAEKLAQAAIPAEHVAENLSESIMRFFPAVSKPAAQQTARQVTMLSVTTARSLINAMGDKSVEIAGEMVKKSSRSAHQKRIDKIRCNLTDPKAKAILRAIYGPAAETPYWEKEPLLALPAPEIPKIANDHSPPASREEIIRSDPRMQLEYWMMYGVG